MKEKHLRILARVLKTDLVYAPEAGPLRAYFDNTAESPLMQSEELRRSLTEGAMAQSAPFMRKDSYDCYFAGIRVENGILFMGPMYHQRLSPLRQYQMLSSYGIEADSARICPVFTLPEMRDQILLVNTVLENPDPENEDILEINQILPKNESAIRKEQTRKVMHEEEENDDSAFRHSYYDEQLCMQAVREGRAQDAVRLAEGMDGDAGRLSRVGVRHRRNLAIVGIALCARAAIDGGTSPEEAYRISGYYIQKCDEDQDPAQMLYHRNKAIEDLAGSVEKKLNRQRASAYVERAQDYIRKHYREKIYLEDIAELLGISPSYLSRLFRQETGCQLQTFINEERVFRASNLLAYSDYSLSKIAYYVGFPNQSYFGKIFKQCKGVSPRIYRDLHQTPEAGEKRN